MLLFGGKVFRKSGDLGRLGRGCRGHFLKAAHGIRGDGPVRGLRAVFFNDVFAQTPEQIRQPAQQARRFREVEADAALVRVALGKVHRGKALHRRGLGAQKTHMAQVIDAGNGIVGTVGRVKAGRDFFEAPGPHHLREGRVQLAGGGKKAAPVRRKTAYPSPGRGVGPGMPDDQRRFVPCRVVGVGRGDQVALAKVDGCPLHGRMSAGAKNMDGAVAVARTSGLTDSDSAFVGCPAM